MSLNVTLNEKELSNFSKHANSWWDDKGVYASLHALNPTRLSFIHSLISKNFPSSPPSSLEILDVGCGGGLVCEPLSRLGYTVTGLDACPAAIEVATSHATEGGLSINYLCTSAEELAKENKTFDVITCLELVEHVDNLEILFRSLKTLLKKDGLLFVSTLNKTAESYLKGIIAAEWILNWVPKGTHTWSKFLKPSELEEIAAKQGFELKKLQGLSYSPFSGFYLSLDLNVNYFAVFKSLSAPLKD